MASLSCQLLALSGSAELPSDPILIVATGITVGLICICLWLTLTTINAWIGLRQKREGNGTWGRLLRVAGTVAAMQVAPAGLGLLIWACTRHSQDSAPLLTMAVIVTLPTMLFLWPAMGPTVRFRHSGEPLPLIDDEGLRNRVAELSGRLSIKTPVVRLLPTGGGELNALAFAGGLVSPSLVVGDGILHRLSAEERDATLAHELAHIANHSLWWLTAVVPFGAIGALLISTVVPRAVAIAFGFALYVGLRHLVSRHFEYDCDRRAAEVLGYSTTFSALSKIHAANPLRDSGWLSYVIFAMATHPSRTERLAALRQAAPTNDCPPMTSPEGELQRRRTVSRVAAGIWLLSLVVIPFWARRDSSSPWPAVVLWTIGMTPSLAILLDMRHATREKRRRMARKRRWNIWLIVAAAVAFLIWGFGAYWFCMSFAEISVSSQPITRILAPLALMIGTTIALISCILTLWKGVGSRIRHQVMIAMQTRNFDRVFELAERSPKAFKKSAGLRHNLGFAAVIAGQRERGIEVLEALRMDEPGYVESVLVLAMTHLDEGRADEALALVEEAREKLPSDPTPVMLRGLCLRHLGRLDEAQKCVDRALELKPESGNTHAVAAWIALDRGDIEQAEALLAKGEEHDPATAFIEYVKAEVVSSGDDADAARAQVRRAVQASDANPFALLQHRIRRLNRRITGE